MDFFPSLGESGLLDELFWFGPLALQLILYVFFFWLTGKWIHMKSRGTRFAFAVVMLIAADILLFVAFVVVFKLANPALS